MQCILETAYLSTSWNEGLTQMTQSEKTMLMLDAARVAKGAPLSFAEAAAMCRDLGLSHTLAATRRRALQRRTTGSLVVRDGTLELVH